MSSPPSVADVVRGYTHKFEDALEPVTELVKPHIAAIGRFLIVVTFMEDALRIVTQWSDQLTYLRDYRNIPTGLTHMFLLFNIIVMIVASIYIVANKHMTYSAFALMGVVIIQGLGYGLIFDLNFFLRNLSVIGALVLVCCGAWVRRTSHVAGLPTIKDEDKKKYVLLVGRCLLVFLFIGFVFSGEWSFWRVLVSVAGLLACTMVIVGFKARSSAVLLILVLSVFNIVVNNFWTLHPHHPHKDFAKYDFFQILSIVGGLLLFVDIGPGHLSYDEKKKVY